jgi:circadian clock protein KaiB
MRTSRRSAKKRRTPQPSISDSTAEFERLLRGTSLIQHYSLRLYVCGTTVRSTQAVANIRTLCEEYLTGRYDLEVVDIYQQPNEAVNQQIVAAPTLVKKWPKPPKRLVGDLSDRERVLVGLNLKGKAGAKATWSKI